MVELIWDNKQEMLSEINSEIFYQTDKKLIPCIEESKNFDNTENLYIEGDNLDALKLLKKDYENKIKMIYIDPPYNTEKKFIYNDTFRNKKKKECRHSGWLNMLYPRLKLAQNLLTDDGVIFISIDDNEVENLKKICDEVFGESNFVGQWNWFKSGTPPNLSKKIKKNIEYILCYEKRKNSIKYKGLVKTSASNNGLMNQTNRFSSLVFPANVVQTNLPNDVYKQGKYGTDSYEINLLADTEVKNGIFIKEIRLEGKFKWGQDNLLNEISQGTVISIKTKSFSPSYEKSEYDPEVPPNLIDGNVNVDTTENAGKKLTELFNQTKVFDYPKPVNLIMYLNGFICDSHEIILDFFSGSATTAHAVMQLNAEDGGNRKFIMVQLPEETDEKSEAYKAGYKNICEIGKERIRRAGEKIKADKPNVVFDDGFKVYKIN